MNEVNWAEMLAAAGMDPNTPPPEWMNQPEPEPEFYRYAVYIQRNDPAPEGRAMSEYIRCKTMHEAIQQIATCTEYDDYTIESHDGNGYYKIIEHNWNDQDGIFYDKTQGTNGKFDSIWFNSYTYKKRKNMEED